MIRETPVDKYLPPPPYNCWERTLLSEKIQILRGNLLLFRNEEGWSDLKYLRSCDANVEQIVSAVLDIGLPCGYREITVNPDPGNVAKLIRCIFRLAELEIELGLDMNVFCANPEVRSVVHTVAVGVLGEDYDKPNAKSDFYLNNATIVRI